MAKVKQSAGLFVRNPNFVKNDSESDIDDDEFNDSGVSDDHAIEEKPTKKRKNKSKDGKKAKKIKSDEKLTAEEINELKETEELYHSSLFRMQIDETLKEVQLSNDQQEFVKKWLTTFKKFLNKLPSVEISGFAKNLKVIDGTKKPQFNYKPPEDAILFGSHAIETNIEAKSSVDVLLIMPSEFFHKSDYLNQIFIHKRVIYLSYIAKKLIEKGTLGGNIKISNLKNDSSNPVLVLDAEEFNISITATPPENFFKLNRFIPITNNIKLKSVEESTTPTPHYNFEVLYASTIQRNQKILEDQIAKYSNIKNAIKLIKIWLHQREFDAGFHGINGFIVSCYLIYLMKIKKIFHTMSCYQILRVFWNHFGHSQLDVTGITICNEKNLPNQPSLEDFRKFYEVVMIDSSGYCNILSHLSIDLYKRIRIECLNAIEILDDKLINNFQQLFLTPIPFYIQYDHFVSIKCDNNLLEQLINKRGTVDDKINYHNLTYAHARKLIMNVLRRGLGERALSIVPVSINDEENFNVGIILNLEHAVNIVDKGPQSNQPEAEDFRKFWGNKSEIRRFKDGSITESVLWCTADVPIGEKRLICKKIVLFLLKQHFNISIDKINYIAGQFDITIRTIFNELMETNEERSLAAIHAFDELSKELRNLNDLPLEIVSVLGVDSTFRYTDVTPPLANALATKNGFVSKELKGMFLAQKVLNGVIQLTASGKWPDEIDAMQRIKAAFYNEIAKKTQVQYPTTIIHVMSDCIEVLKNKFVFRLKIVHPKEIALAKEEISPTNNLTKLYRENEESLKLEYESKVLPKLTSFLHGLHHRFASYGPTVAIAKRWLYSQLIDSFLWPDECTELIIAEMFLKNFPMKPTFQPQTGFIRFLYYLVNFSPENDMIVVNFNEEMDVDQINELETNFHKNRKNFPPLFIVTSSDLPHQFGMYSSRAPSIEILKRVKMLAEFSIKILSQDYAKLNESIVEDLFTPSFEGYNLLINLNEKFVRKSDIVKYKFANFKAIQYEKKTPVGAGIDFVASFLKELREAFNDIALFFYNPISGNKIAMLWKPSIKESKKFAASHVNMCKLVNEKLHVNIDAILNDINIIGAGIIDSIEIC
ncbi:hypothetical protein PVAND_003021 [Polypedilum vanderplanki]|uniref:Nucleolar protein 6 n=1 Tax=Polypedilum vanderplanki TaxID=319348 RepID=A0A9J6BUG3_POLVA|nr:hypothetical protein PVAND_003021 [Polypedilum vanderplanki]